MKCGCDNCFECPYPDCILDEEDQRIDARKQRRKKYHAKWYAANQETVKARALANYYANREERLKKKKEYYYRKKKEGLLDAKKQRS